MSAELQAAWIQTDEQSRNLAATTANTSNASATVTATTRMDQEAFALFAIRYITS